MGDRPLDLRAVEARHQQTVNPGNYPGDVPALLTALRETRAALVEIQHELGVPGPEYPAPVANAYEIAAAGLAQVRDAP